jgi:hypothetical protein
MSSKLLFFDSLELFQEDHFKIYVNFQFQLHMNITRDIIISGLHLDLK